MNMQTRRAGMRGTVLLLMVLAACGSVRGQFVGPTQSGATVQRPSAAVAGETQERVIIPGDVLAIFVYGLPELTTGTALLPENMVGNAQQVSGFRVSGSGEISLPYIGKIAVAGKTSGEAVELLRRRLQEGGILVAPEVNLAVVDSPGRIVSVLGEVTKPSPVRAFEKIRLLDAVSSCGGFTAQASHVITIHRRDSPLPIVVDLGNDPARAVEANIVLQPGDTVVVAKQGGIFVVGEVHASSLYLAPNNAPLTVTSAIALAGGVKYGAAMSRARIYRTTVDHQRTILRFDLKKVMYGKQDDIVLAANDILFIPPNPLKATIAAGGVTAAESILYGATYAEATLK